MGDLKMLTVPLVVLLLMPSTSHSAELYRACLMECFNCVQTYGKDFYNGKICADNCANSFGQSIDTKCFPPEKRTGKSPSLTSSCIKQCESSRGHKEGSNFNGIAIVLTALLVVAAIYTCQNMYLTCRTVVAGHV